MLFGRLEWFNEIDINKIYILKINIVSLEEVPSFIKIMLFYIRALRFDEIPDYDYLVNLMLKVFNHNSFKSDFKFEWS